MAGVGGTIAGSIHLSNAQGARLLYKGLIVTVIHINNFQKRIE